MKQFRLSHLIFILCVYLLLISNAAAFPSGADNVFISDRKGVRFSLLKHIAPLVETSIANNNYPGAIVIAAHKGKIIYRGIFGDKRILPDRALMTYDTLFDLASLTKVVATTPAIMQLIEQKKINLDARLAKYLPSYANNGKEKITIRELLTHTSGLPPDINPTHKNKLSVLKEIEKLPLRHQPGKVFVYSDLNFIILAHLVEKITHQPFNLYVNQHIFKPLGMTHTYFLPAEKLKNNIAPTEIMDGQLRWGQVHDPIAFAMGGVSGNAGLFSNAHDLALYAQWLLDERNHLKTTTILSSSTILKMTTPQTPAAITDVRGLGWDINSYLSNRGDLFPMTAFGHTGWTGTSILIDPTTQSWLIMLTSRTHPHLFNHNHLSHDRREIANIIAASLTDTLQAENKSKLIHNPRFGSRFQLPNLG